MEINHESVIKQFEIMTETMDVNVEALKMLRDRIKDLEYRVDELERKSK